MKVLFHPDFPRDQRKFEADYAEISTGLAARIRIEIDDAIMAVESAPCAAGHFVNTGSAIVLEFTTEPERLPVLCALRLHV